MKGYKDYMDNISVDPLLHKKIMSQLTKKTISRRWIKYVYRFAGIAACLAILLFGVWAVPNLFSNLTPENEWQSGYIVCDQNEATQDKEIISPSLVLHALTFNTVESVMPVRMMIPDGYFDYDLTYEQLGVLFPNLGLTLAATAHYRNNGSLWFVSASEYEWDGIRRNFTWTTIHLGNEGVMPDSTLLFPRDNPIISEVHGVLVTAFVYGANNENFRAYFVLNGIAYRVETSDIMAINAGIEEHNGMERLTELVNKIIVGGSADLSILDNPTVPELRNDRLTLDEAQLDAYFSVFLPQNIPSGFTFESATRLINARNNSLFVSWSSGIDVITWYIRTPLESDLLNIVSVNYQEKFDVSLYTTPWFGSVPIEFHYYFQSPVFLADEFTLDIIEARTRLVDNGRMGTVPRWETTQFGVLFGDVLVKVSMTGTSPIEIWEMFSW